METMIEHTVEWGVATYTISGQLMSGDRHVICPTPQGILLAVVDGVGHGPAAAEAADHAVTTVTKYAGESVMTLFKTCHAHLRETRGVVMSLAVINTIEGSMTWMGVGNVEGVVVRGSITASPRLEPLLLRGGVVGNQLPPLYASIIPMQRGDTLIFVTDGIRRNFTDMLVTNDGAQQVADRILAKSSKGSDDALVLVARYRG
jgi:negative regulator of sigma-B (phosphoserine phosphatase)